MVLGQNVTWTYEMGKLLIKGKNGSKPSVRKYRMCKGIWVCGK